MVGRSVLAVMVPRFSLYVGAGSYYTQPIVASPYSRITLDFWNGNLIGTAAPTVAVSFQEANDPADFQDCVGGPWSVPSGPGESQFVADLSMSWFQFGVIVAGTDAGVTCWAQGLFELRER